MWRNLNVWLSAEPESPWRTMLVAFVVIGLVGAAGFYFARGAIAELSRMTTENTR